MQGWAFRCLASIGEAVGRDKFGPDAEAALTEIAKVVRSRVFVWRAALHVRVRGCAALPDASEWPAAT